MSEQATSDSAWSVETISNQFNLLSQQAEAVANAWDSEQELVSEYKQGKSLSDYAGIGHQTVTALEVFIDQHYPDADAVRRENSKGIATEFGTDGDTTDDGALIWWYVCPRCGEKQLCEGDPTEFAGRPYRCHACNWVAALAGEDMDNIKVMHADQNRTGNDQSHRAGTKDDTDE